MLDGTSSLRACFDIGRENRLTLTKAFPARPVDSPEAGGPSHASVCVMHLYCDRCLTPFTEADCWPDVTPPGEDWSEFCPSCRERKLKFYLEEADRSLDRPGIGSEKAA